MTRVFGLSRKTLMKIFYNNEPSVHYTPTLFLEEEREEWSNSYFLKNCIAHDNVTGHKRKLKAANAFRGAMPLQVSDERAPAPALGQTSCLRWSLPSPAGRPPECSPTKRDALDGLHTAEAPSSSLGPHPPPFCQMSLQTCPRKKLATCLSSLKIESPGTDYWQIIYLSKSKPK